MKKSWPKPRFPRRVYRAHNESRRRRNHLRKMMNMTGKEFRAWEKKVRRVAAEVPQIVGQQLKIWSHQDFQNKATRLKTEA